MKPRFSSRLCWDLRPNRLAKALAAKLSAGAKLLDLTESNPTRAGFLYPSEQILTALAEARSLRYDPNPAGAPEAREAVANYYRARGHSIDGARVLLTTSTSESYAWLFKLLADPGDEILVPCPSYPLFEFLAAMESVRIVPYWLRYHHGWYIDFESLLAGITARTRAIALVNPNNPTGSFVKTGELTRLVEICAARELAVISDEVFSDYAFAPDPARVGTLVDVSAVLTFCLSGLSKVIGMPQMKLGWIVVGGPEEARARAYERLELIGDTYLSVSTPVQHAAPRLLAIGASIRDQIASRVKENLEFLRGAVGSGSSYSLLEAEGGWYAVIQAPGTRSEEQWCLDWLEQDDVRVQPGFFYDFESEAHLVVSLLTKPEHFQEGVRRCLSRSY